MLSPYPAYRRLLQIFRAAGDDTPTAARYLSGAYFGDLITWYHLAWVGEADRRSEPLFARLMTKASGFTHDDRRELFGAIGRIVAGLLGRYRVLAETGRIELSTTPGTHPIGPLLLDFSAARDTLADAPLPASPEYPRGRERLEWHLRTAVESHRRRFGREPVGLWPAEGAVSAPFVEALGQQGLHWTASSESVLANSLDPVVRSSGRQWLYRPWRLDGVPGVAMVFRDERLSDQIGFEYSKWHGLDAASHLIGELERIADAAPPGETPLVLIAMDGENAWEYFPYNGYYFFEELYSALSRHPRIRTRTMTEALSDPARDRATLPRLRAGSWVMGTLSTWIGEPAKNAAWDLLCEAKRVFDEVVDAGLDPARRALLERQLAACEGSDWFWWLGSYNPPLAVERFDRLFRHNLRRLYEMLDRPVPEPVDRPLASGGGQAESGGTMRRAS
jgi:alpha-amylase/alpha-mannosidase (GH57 family)